MAGKLENAKKAFQKALAVYQSLEGVTLNYATMATANLGIVYWLQNYHEQARRVLKQGLEDRERQYPPMDKRTFHAGRLLHALGNVCYSQGMMKESQDYHRKALQQYHDTIGPSHHRYADVCHRVAQHCMRLGELDQAQALIDQALKMWQTDESLYRNEIARTSFLKAKLLFRLGHDELAAKFLQESVSLRASILGRSDPGSGELFEADFDAIVTFWSK